MYCDRSYLERALHLSGCLYRVGRLADFVKLAIRHTLDLILFLVSKCGDGTTAVCDDSGGAKCPTAANRSANGYLGILTSLFRVR